MTVKLPEKAGFVATPDEWDALVRIAENLAAQVVQRDAALREMQAERDAAQRDLIHVAEQWHASEKALDAARADAALLTDSVNDLGDAIGEALIYASGKTEQILRRALGDDDAAERQPAPAQAKGQE